MQYQSGHGGHVVLALAETRGDVRCAGEGSFMTSRAAPPSPREFLRLTASHLIADFEHAVIAVEKAVQMDEMRPAVAEYHRTRDALLKAMGE